MTDQHKINKILKVVEKILYSPHIPDNATGKFPFTLHMQSGGVSGKPEMIVELKADIKCDV